MPAVSLVSTPGRRRWAVEAAVEVEQRGFSGVFCPSLGDALGLCHSISAATETLVVGTSIQPIYLQHPVALASAAAHLHEVSGGRFRLGVGVTHGPVIERLGVATGRPLADMRSYVGAMRATSDGQGGLPPIDLATLRDRMVQLSVEIGDGAVWANASRSRMAHSLGLVPAERLEGGFRVANMIPTVIDDDLEAARARNRSTLRGYVALPNYRNYWIDAGYGEEMEAAGAALASGDDDALSAAMTDEWLDDATLSGPVARVREGVEAWFDAGLTEPILVPSSTSGGQRVALGELFDAYS